MERKFFIVIYEKVINTEFSRIVSTWKGKERKLYENMVRSNIYHILITQRTYYNY